MRVEQRERLGEPGCLRGGAGDDPGRLLQCGQPAAGAILHIKLQAAAGADARHRGRLQHEHEGIVDLRKLLPQIGQDLAAVKPGDTLLERLQRHEDHAGIGRVGERGAVETGERDRILHARARQDDLRGARITASVRASDAPGGNWNAAIR